MVESKTSFDEKSNTMPEVTATPVDDEQQKQMVASGTTGAVLGFLFGGPILSALVGFGAAYVSKKEGAPGDAARALGDMGLSVRNKAIEVDEKHKIVERSGKAVTNAWEGAKEYDRKHNVLEKTREFTVHSWESFVHFIQERRILQQGVDGFGKGYEFVAEKVCGQNNSLTNEEATE